MDREEAILLINLLEEKKRRVIECKMYHATPYEWQKKFYKMGQTNKQRLLMAANRVGKTFSSCLELSFHLTGEYPDWWEGIKFKHPINAWALGVSGEQIRDVLQFELCGRLSKEGFSQGEAGGIIPLSLIGDVTRSMTPKLAKDVKIKHVTGGFSQVSFKSYSQGQHALMGSSVDFALSDEEP